MEAIDWDPDLFGEEKGASTWPTVEVAAYGAIGLLAAGLRFFQLGLRPLSEGEATQALAAFHFTQGTGQAAPAGTIPALFTGNVAGFTLLGASDITTRLLPVLAGMILVLLPYWLRHRLGRIGALAASLLLALSPSAIYFSRALDAAIVVAACGLAFAVGLIYYVDTRRPMALYLVAMAFGLGLCAGPGTFTLLLIFSTFALLLYASDHLLHRDAGWSALLVAWWTARGEKGLLAKVGAVFAATFGLVATAFVLHPAGVGNAADLIATWAKSFLPEVDGTPAIFPLLLLLRYEPLILLLGLVETGYALAGRPADRQAAQPGSLVPHTILLVYWAGAATLIILLSGHRPAGNILLVVVPLALLAGQRLESISRQLTRRYRIRGQEEGSHALWPESVAVAAVGIGLLVFFYLQLAAYGLTQSDTTISFAGMKLYSTTAYLLLAAVALLLLIGLGVAAGVWRGTPLVTGSAWLVAIVTLGLFGFKAMWGLNFAHATDSRELMIGRTTVPEVRLMAESLEALSLAEMGDAHTLPVTVDAATGPVVAWYLREFERQTRVEDLSTPPDTVAAVTLARQDLPIVETFRGQGFPLRTHWLPWGLWEQTLVRWLLFTDASLPIVDQEVVLWVARRS